MPRYSEIRTLARSRPYSARRRLIAAIERHKGFTRKIAEELGVCPETVRIVMRDLGLMEVAAQARDASRKWPKLPPGTPRNQRFSLYRRMFAKTEEGRVAGFKRDMKYREKGRKTGG